MAANKVILYCKPFCHYCIEAKQYLDKHHISYEEKDVIASKDFFNEMKEKSGQDMSPVMDWNGEILSDFDVDELEAFLREKKAL